MRPQGLIEILFRTHKLLWYATDPIRTSAYALVRSCRYTTVVAADGARVGSSVVVLEARRWSKVQCSEGSRFAEQMTTTSISRISNDEERDTYGLGIGARSSNEEARGMWAGTLGEYGLKPPRGLPERPA